MGQGARTTTFTLFVAGTTVRSQRAIDSVERICREIPDPCEVNVVDVLEQPELAERDGVVATPTLIRTQPEPVRRVIGDLSDLHELAAVLDLPRSAV